MTPMVMFGGCISGFLIGYNLLLSREFPLSFFISAQKDVVHMTIFPSQYTPKLDIVQTEKAIKNLKLFFEEALSKSLNLSRVSAPLFVLPETGLNDDLNGIERPVSFGILEQGNKRAEIVQSLAKWKRFALGKYGFAPGQGLYTDMNAIRRDETTDNFHSIYVDQWDWEAVIHQADRHADTLRQVVTKIYDAIHATGAYITSLFPHIQHELPPAITFISTQELEDQYPNLTPKEREDVAARQFGAVFIMGIGGPLRSGKIHDGRAPDYDDWNLNGDILLYFPLFDRALEISSMGIRVDADALRKQCQVRETPDRLDTPFCRAILEGQLPYTIGGGIGQSRLSMFMLQKAHVGEVQCSIWPPETLAECQKAGIPLL